MLLIGLKKSAIFTYSSDLVSDLDYLLILTTRTKTITTAAPPKIAIISIGIAAGSLGTVGVVGVVVGEVGSGGVSR